MSIAAANLFTRNIYRAFFKPDATPGAGGPGLARSSRWWSSSARWCSCSRLDQQNAINFQLLGGVWILQTFPAIVLGLYTRWFHRWALLVGWAVGMVYGTITAYQQSSPATEALRLVAGPGAVRRQVGYIALTAFVLNIVVAVVLTFVFRAMKAPDGVDQTEPSDYFADAGDPRVQPIDELTEDSSRRRQHVTSAGADPAGQTRGVRRPRRARGPGVPRRGVHPDRLALPDGAARRRRAGGEGRAHGGRGRVRPDPRHRDVRGLRLAVRGAHRLRRGRRVPDARGRPGRPRAGCRRGPGPVVHRPRPRLRRTDAATVHPARHGRGRSALPAARLRPHPGAGLAPEPGVDLITYGRRSGRGSPLDRR